MTDLLILEPEMPEEKPDSEELVLEAVVVPSSPLCELSFDGMLDAEERIADAMAEYDKAMDETVEKI